MQRWLHILFQKNIYAYKLGHDTHNRDRTGCAQTNEKYHISSFLEEHLYKQDLPKQIKTTISLRFSKKNSKQNICPGCYQKSFRSIVLSTNGVYRNNSELPYLYVSKKGLQRNICTGYVQKNFLSIVQMRETQPSI